MIDILTVDPDSVTLEIAKELGMLDASDMVLLKKLNAKEIEIYLQNVSRVIQEAQDTAAGSAKPTKNTLDDHWKLDYKRRPPTLKEFIEDPYWLGTICTPNDPDNPEAQGLFKYLRERLLEDFDYESRVHNAVLTGSLGSGKSFCAVIIMLYRITLATLLKNPAVFFGLNPGTNIVYAIISVTLGQVDKTAFGDAKRFMGASPYFRNECGFDPNSKYANGEIRLPGNIVLVRGSNSNHIIGQNLIGVFLDEGNFQNGPAPDEKAYALYGEARRRIQNRYMKADKVFPAITLIASSAKDESSFTEKVIAEIEKINDKKREVVWRNAVYKVKRDLLGLGPIWFKACFGLKTQEPYILEGFYDESGNPVPGEYVADGTKTSDRDIHENLPKGATAELVPLMYLDEFRRNPRKALQEISGVPIGGSNRFFPSLVDVERCTELAEADGVINPCIKGINKLVISMEDDKQIWDFVEASNFLTKVQSAIGPKRHPWAKRYAHVDLATRTLGGISICHLTGSQQKVSGVLDSLSNQPFSEYRMIVEYDFILTIAAGKLKPIDLSKVRKFFFWLRDKCGYEFGRITFDQFQSVDSLQELEKAGFPVGQLSVDRDKKPYLSVKQGFEELRIRPYRSDLMWHELENLVENEKKVDHPPNGSKDLVDSLTGSYFNAITSDEVPRTSSNTNPSIIGNSRVDGDAVFENRPLISIQLPEGYTQIRTFKC